MRGVSSRACQRAKVSEILREKLKMDAQSWATSQEVAQERVRQRETASSALRGRRELASRAESDVE